jgi:hypothetical protein
VTCNGAKQAVEIQGLAENAIEDVLLEDVRITAKRGLSAEHARGLRLKRVNLSVESGPLFRLLESQQVDLGECPCPTGTDVFLRLEGAATQDVRLGKMDLTQARQPVEFAEGAKPEALAKQP